LSILEGTVAPPWLRNDAYRWLARQVNWKVTVEIVKWLLQSIVTIGFVAIAMVVLAGLFMVVFSIAAGIDRRINQ
jgi:hypothetical protein